MTDFQEVDKYFKCCKPTYDALTEKSAFEEICLSYGLVKVDENAYKFPKEKLTYVHDEEGDHYLMKSLTISSKDNYIEARGIPLDETMSSENISSFIYQFHYKDTSTAFYLCADDTVKIYSLRGLILFLDLIKYYGYSTNLSVSENLKGIKKLNKRIEKYRRSHPENSK